MQHSENFCDVTLVSEYNERIRAHTVVLASCVYPFRHMFQTDNKNTYYELIHMSGVFSKFMIS